jgi:dipeptidyl aminopeptidase/acylaminoacyl peptidase
MKKYLLLCFIICFMHCLTAQENRLIKATDMLQIKSISGLSLNNDGSKAVFTVTSIEPDGDSKWEYKYVNQLWMVSTEGDTSPKQLTAKESSSQAAWSPDGKQIVFVRVADSKPQLFLLSLSGGEAVQLTKFKYGAVNPKWSPDGKQIIFSASIPLRDLLTDSMLNPNQTNPVWSLEKPGFSKNEQLRNTAKPNPDGSIEEVRAYLDNNAADKKAKVIDNLNFLEESTASSDMAFNHFFITGIETGSAIKSLTHGFYNFNSADFTPGGEQLVISGNIDSLQHPDRSLESEIFIADSDGSNIRVLLGEKTKTFISPKISPSGKWLAFQLGNTSFVNVPQLAIMPLNGSAKDMITIPFDRVKTNLTWSNDEKFIYLTAQSNGGAPVYRIELSTRKAEQLSSYDAGISSMDLRNDKLVYVKTAVTNPFELYLADAYMKNEKPISNFNSDWIKNKNLSFPEKKTFTNEKGLTIEYWVMKPTNYEAGKKYPLLLDIHGGPSAMWGPGEASMWHEFQYFCSKGYGVVYCNPRGSGGYGLDFLRANVNNWGVGPTSDVLTSLDKTVALGWADTSKLLVSGGSYAGYLVAWIISHDQRFKAACSQRGVYDLATFFGEGNAWRLVPNYFGGYPWDEQAKKNILRESPINYVKNIKTPYLIFHGENDMRTGVIQSQMLYKSLKVLDKPVEYVRHPGATHELTRSGNNRQRIDQMVRTWEFFERWVGKK